MGETPVLAAFLQSENPSIHCNMAATKLEPAVHLCAQVEGSFAYKTVKDRLPVILTKVIDLLSRKASDIESNYGPISREETKKIIGRLSKLRNELQTNKNYVPVQDSFEDVAIWNEHLPQVSTPRWFDGIWLLAECYLYRRIFESFQMTTKLKEYDYFGEQKENALLTSMLAVNALTEVLAGGSSKVELSQLIEVSLWGNKCDVSFSGGEENSQKVDLFSQLDTLRVNILQNDVTKVVEYIQSKKSLKIDFLLDNAGFELVTDLILMDYMTRQNLVLRIHIFVKVMPWYVSDALVHDLHYVISRLEQSDFAPTAFLGKRCRGYLEAKQWSIEKRIYWTLPFPYADMSHRDPKLYQELKQSDLIIFKGDLNYRKLVGDRAWKPTTNFRASLMGFEPAPLITLRTIKAETVTGLVEGAAETAKQKSKDWMVSGEFAVVQFVDTRC
ncbi:protein-glutamate O-methyltransferase-like [Tropilaelaps mercedesae]|uniref:Sugar phosphate phosphatase n=1 Tax=Tropilaelaps mercedesae TaxID=418985 RepID=A0A1V9XE57_9ACAR|nr:protein-glutamate O-methyltransferase-like [Tropilaelaps mercedesae]